MLKRLMFMLFALLLTVSAALAQAIAPRCRVCGRKLTECPYKGNHVKKQSEGKKHPVKKPEKKINRETKQETQAATVDTPTPSTRNEGYAVVAEGTVDVEGTKGLRAYLKANTPPADLKVTGTFGYDALKLLRRYTFKTLDLSGLHFADSSEEANAQNHILGADFCLQWIDGINADNLILPDDVSYLETEALGYTVKNLYIGKNVKKISFVEEALHDGTYPDNLHESKLLNIYVDTENDYYKSVDGVLFNYHVTELLMYPAGRVDYSGKGENWNENKESNRRTLVNHYVVPSSVAKIADYAFFNTMVQNLDLGLITRIGKYAFAYARVKVINIPLLTGVIGEGAFDHCNNLRMFTFCGNVHTLSDRIFEHCPDLQEVRFERNKTSIPEGLFKYSKRLSIITIGNFANPDRDSFSPNLANDIARAQFVCPLPIFISTHVPEPVLKQYKQILKNKKKFNFDANNPFKLL